MYEDSAFEIDVEIGDYELKLQMNVIENTLELSEIKNI
jgi:hypothetical protein